MFCQVELFQTMNELEIESRRLSIVVFGDEPCLRIAYKQPRLPDIFSGCMGNVTYMQLLSLAN